MNDHELNELRQRLRAAIPPPKPELARDLWPVMLARLNEPARIRVPWFDWLLLGAACVLALVFPGLIPALLYHL
ncbi:MAG TPA: hypothetical protein VKD70_02325 [Candidatus Acidoferrum sp.]|nr:hypothetical protein [Candidatus Acidoferrum sp.]